MRREVNMAQSFATRNGKTGLTDSKRLAARCSSDRAASNSSATDLLLLPAPTLG